MKKHLTNMTELLPKTLKFANSAVIKVTIITMLTFLSVPCYGSNFNLPPGFESISEQDIDLDAETILPPPTRSEIMSSTTVNPEDEIPEPTDRLTVDPEGEANWPKPDNVLSSINPNTEVVQTAPSKPESTGLTAESLLFPTGRPPAPENTLESTDTQLETNALENSSILQVELLGLRPLYQEGDYLNFTLRSNQNCYLTLISEGTSGKTMVLFPNRERTNNLIQANKTYTIPGNELLPIKALQISKSDNPVNEKEQITAICRKKNTPVFNTLYRFQDYSHRVFSVDESWQSAIRGVEKRQESRKIFSFRID